MLYARYIDTYNKVNELKYYKVTLTEKVSHLFLRGFAPMEAKIVSFALLKPHDTYLITIINQLEEAKVIANREYQNKWHIISDKWNHYRQTMNVGKAVSYTDGDDWCYEKLVVTPKDNTSTANRTSANGGKLYSEKRAR